MSVDFPYAISLGGIVFSGQSSPKPGWYYRSLTDWGRLAESKRNSESNPLGDGDYPGDEIHRGSLVISFEVMYIGEDHADALDARDRLMAWGASRADLPMTVHDEAGEWTRFVEIRNVQPQDTRGRRFLFAAVDVKASDPLRYSPETVIPTGLPDGSGGFSYPFSYPYHYKPSSGAGAIVLRNNGSAETAPILEVTGGLSQGVELTVNGVGRLRLERQIPDGSFVAFDMKDEQAYLDGVSPITTFMTARDWFLVPPHGQATVAIRALGTVTGTPELRGRLRSASW